MVQYIVTLCLGILDTYREIEDSAEFDDDCLREIVTLGGIRDPGIYKTLLSQFIADIDNDHLLKPEKLRGLAAVLLNVAGMEKQRCKEYCSGDDLKACLTLICRKFDGGLLSDDNAEIHDMLDTLNVVLGIMASMRLEGLTPEDSSALEARLGTFARSTTRKLEGGMGMRGGEEIERGFPLRMKVEYGRHALA